MKEFMSDEMDVTEAMDEDIMPESKENTDYAPDEDVESTMDDAAADNTGAGLGVIFGAIGATAVAITAGVLWFNTTGKDLIKQKFAERKVSYLNQDLDKDDDNYFIVGEKTIRKERTSKITGKTKIITKKVYYPKPVYDDCENFVENGSSDED